MAGYSWSEYSELLFRAWLKDVRSPNCVTILNLVMLVGPKGPPKWVHVKRERNLAVIRYNRRWQATAGLSCLRSARLSEHGRMPLYTIEMLIQWKCIGSLAALCSPRVDFECAGRHYLY
jgi:hypothetical protein